MKICLLGFHPTKFWTGSSQLKVQKNLFEKLNEQGVITDLYIFNEHKNIFTKLYYKLTFEEYLSGKIISGGLINYTIYLLRQKYSIIHFIVDRYYQFILLFLIKCKKTKIITTYHDLLTFPKPLNFRIKNISIYFLKLFQFIISDYIFLYNLNDKATILKYFPSTKILIVKNGVEEFYFEKVKIKLVSGRMMYAGGFKYKHKGFLFMKAVAERLNDKIEIVSCGYEGLVKFGQFKGLLNDMDLREELYNSSFLIIPSEYESFSILALESLACGTPVILTKCTGVTNYLEEGKDGCLFFEFGDLDDCINKICMLLTDYNQLKQFSTNARSAARRFTWDIVTSEYIQFYNEVIEDNN